jgi:hypothetical protein
MFESDMMKWKREADEADRIRESNRAALRRQEEADRRAAMRTRQDAAEVDQRLSSIEARLDALELVVSGLNGVADGAAQFSTATVARLEELAGLATKVDTALTTMRAVHAREIAALRDRLAAAESTSSRELAVVGRQLAQAQRELDQHKAGDENSRTRAQVADLSENVGNVVELLREDLQTRRR